MKKILCLLSALLIIAASFVSCAMDPGNTVVSTTAAPAATTEPSVTDPVDENGYRLDNLGEIDLGGRTMRILYWGTMRSTLSSMSAKSLSHVNTWR